MAQLQKPDTNGGNWAVPCRWQTIGSVRMGITLQYREPAQRVYYGAVFEVKKEFWLT